jgi:hypothetical protein
LVTKSQRNASGDSEQEYRAIEATLLASPRGRWFLAEHGRRARRLDNAMLEDAIGRLTSSLREPTALIDQLRTQIESIRSIILKVQGDLTTRPLASRGGASGGAGTAAEPNFAQRILSAAEDMHELAWTLQGREGRDFNQLTLERISRQVVSIYALSRHQAVDTEYTLQLVQQLAQADSHVVALLDVLALEDGPADGDAVDTAP